MDVTGFWLDESCSVPHVPKTSTIVTTLLYNLGKSLEASPESLSSQPLSEYGNSSQPSQPLFEPEPEPEPEAQVAEADPVAKAVAELAKTMKPEELDLLLNLTNAVEETEEEFETHSFSEGISFEPIKIQEQQMRARKEVEDPSKYSRRTQLLMPKGGSKSKKYRKSKKTKKSKKTRTKKTRRIRKSKSKKTRKR
jgi:hypothetical protein